MSLRDLARKNTHQSSGVTLVEVALSITIFLSLLLFSLWLNVMIGSVASLNHALRSGLRLAITRSDVVSGLSLPTELNTYFTTKNHGTWHTNFNQLIEADLTPGSLELLSRDLAPRYWDGCGAGDPDLPLSLAYRVKSDDAKSFYAKKTLNVFASSGCGGEVSLAQMPPVYALSLMYVYETMRASVGSSIKYPCDPTQATGAGCIDCRFLNPDGIEDEAILNARFNGYQVPTAGGNVTGVQFSPRVPYYRIYLQCDYRPSLRYLSPIGGRFISSLTQVIRSRYYYRGQPAL